MLLLLFATSYPNSSIELPGVRKDVLNITNLCEKFKIELQVVEDEFLTKFNIENHIQVYNPDIIWFSGHGILDNKENNCFILPGYTKTNRIKDDTVLRDYEFAHMLEDWTKVCKKTCLIILDMCYSGTMVNLKYFFEHDEFFEKLNDSEYEPDLKDESTGKTRLIISVSGATDFQTTNESTEGGGYLSKMILELFEENPNFSLNNLNSLKHVLDEDKNNLIISVSKIVNPYKNIF